MNRTVGRLEARLELDPWADTVIGTLTGDDGRERPFSGWMELASAVEAWRTDGRPGPSEDHGPAPPREPRGEG
jgi:hypothetical protein